MKYIDYGTMQSDAQRRVLEMQRRAHSAVRYEGPAASGHRSEPEKIFSQTPEQSAPDDISSSACPEPDETVPAHCTSKNTQTQPDFQKLLPRDPEQLLLLMVLVLLLTENADMILVLALVYMII